MEKKGKLLTTQTIAILGFLIALEIVLERVISIPVGDITRFSIGKAVVVMAGVWFGPVAGAIVGMISDILGGVLAGYGLSINPLITLSSMMWGIIPALIVPRIKGTKTFKIIIFCVSILVNSVVSTLCLTTAGLILLYGYNFYALLPVRLVQFAALVPCYCIVCSVLYFSPVTNMVYNLTRDNKQKAKA